MKIALFIPCLNEHLFPEPALSMAKIFDHLGHSVEYVENQTCCGQPAFNSGYRKEVVPLAERFIELFKDKNGQSGLSPTKMSKKLKMHYNTLRKYLNILHEFGMIKIFVKNNKKIYFLDHHNYNKTQNGIKSYSKQIRSNIVQEFLSAF